MNRRNLLKAMVGGVALVALPTLASTEEISGTLFGNAFDLIPMGTGEGVEIVGIGNFGDSSFQVLIRNHTDKIAYIGSIGCTVTTANGEDVGGTDRYNFYIWPYGIAPQSVGIAQVSIEKYHDFKDIPLDATMTFEFNLWDDEEPDMNHSQNLTILDAVLGVDEVVVTVRNDTGAKVKLMEAFGTVLNTDGTIQGFVRGRPEQEEMAVGEELTFSAGYRSSVGPMNDRFILGASGYIED